MKGTRTGKIARLPRPIRQELNLRLDNGKQGKQVVAWLNGLSEVQSVMAAEFNPVAVALWATRVRRTNPLPHTYPRFAL